VAYVTGEHYLDNLENYDLIVKSPGISPYLNKLEKFVDKMTSPTEIFCNNYS
jgi:UDP-N-acetylmuramoylalanine-D-glutamate ligase